MKPFTICPLYAETRRRELDGYNKSRQMSQFSHSREQSTSRMNTTKDETEFQNMNSNIRVSYFLCSVLQLKSLKSLQRTCLHWMTVMKSRDSYLPSTNKTPSKAGFFTIKPEIVFKLKRRFIPFISPHTRLSSQTEFKNPPQNYPLT